MIDINGIGGVSGSRPQRPDGPPDRRDTDAPRAEGRQDGVVISSTAQAVARITQLIQAAEGQDDARIDRVEAARQRIESGDYRQRDIVATVAERVAKFL
jgi:anti-sigma28 factor (negative regulator of flagellin synthesis)